VLVVTGVAAEEEEVTKGPKVCNSILRQSDGVDMHALNMPRKTCEKGR